MRFCRLILYVLTGWLTGCTSTYHPVLPFPDKKGKATETETTQPLQSVNKITLYNNPADLLSKPFRDLGEVKAEGCQISKKYHMTSQNLAHKKLQANAAAMNANAVLLHQCRTEKHHAGCYRYSLCEGTALQVTR